VSRESTRSVVCRHRTGVATRLKPKPIMRPIGVGKFAWLLDFHGYTMANAPPLKVSLHCNSILANHYPERLGLACCFHSPMLFSMTWKVGCLGVWDPVQHVLWRSACDSDRAFIGCLVKRRVLVTAGIAGLGFKCCLAIKLIVMLGSLMGP
jgi:hypothetical protein